jgi:hypothetical protein
MTFIQFVKLFSPPILLPLLNRVRNIVRSRGKKSNCYGFYSTIHLHKKERDTIFILGNGPSLKNKLEKFKEILATQTCLCVNSFILTDYYERIKPRVFIFVDPVGFVPLSSQLQDVEKESIAIFKSLISKTNWHIDAIFPSHYKNNERVLSLKENPLINILFVNMENYASYWSRKKHFNLFNKNKIPAPAQTVLNTAVYLAVFWRYNNIVLLGADLSMHERLSVDEKTNILYINDEHFYGNLRRVIYKDSEKGIPFKINELFFAFARMHELFWLLREYADFNSVRIFNASGKSYIDAFERATIEDFLKI